MAKILRAAAAFLFVVGGASPVHAQEAEAEWVLLRQASAKLREHREYGMAVAVAELALELAEKDLGPDHPEVATCLYYLGGNHEAQAGIAKGRKAASPFMLRSLQIWENVLEGPCPAEYFSHENLEVLRGLLGFVAYRQNMPARADALLDRLNLVLEETLGPDSLELAISLDARARRYNPLFPMDAPIAPADFQKAEALYRRSLSIREKALGPDHIDLAESLSSLAEIYEKQGDLAAAEANYSRSLAIVQAAVPPDDWRLAGAQGDLASLYLARGEPAKAEVLFRRFVDVYETKLAEASPDDEWIARFALSSALRDLAAACLAMGREEEALELESRAEQVWPTEPVE